uniref:Uncharacterized protein n=1 Tax=Nelumbo nucifera TaxID=4432 RepID=A0A822XZ69_NELNU|nr:TPA_asm: hypothetical protein HUJ06_025975 [Nelumbo nucifera]
MCTERNQKLRTEPDNHFRCGAKLTLSNPHLGPSIEPIILGNENSGSRGGLIQGSTRPRLEKRSQDNLNLRLLGNQAWPLIPLALKRPNPGYGMRKDEEDEFDLEWVSCEEEVYGESNICSVESGPGKHFIEEEDVGITLLFGGSLPALAEKSLEP